MPATDYEYSLKPALLDFLSQKPGFVWLHIQTIEGEKYELIGFEPRQFATNLAPQQLQSFIREFTPPKRIENIQSLFNGGFMGYLSYEYGRMQSQHKAHTGANITEMQFPPSCFVGYYPTNFLVIDHQRQTIQGDLAYPEEIKLKENRPPAEFRPSRKFSALWSKHQYQRAFKKIKSYINSGDCYQVNLTQPIQARYQGDPFSAFKKVLAKHNAPHFAFIRTGKGDVLSFSPESFLSIDHHKIQTKPIKGTRKRHSDPDADHAIGQELLHSEKDRAENVMIVDLLRNDLGRIAKTGSVQVADLCKLESFSNVHHLVSTVEATLKPGVEPMHALLTCSPGGSITGAPKIRAMEIIDELEDFPRSVYCGSIFMLGLNGRLESNIAIRTMTCKNGVATVWGGGGIVADSDEEAEYRESLDKIRHIVEVLESKLKH